MQTPAARTFFDRYAAAFARDDAEALADFFVFPVHVVGDAEEIAPRSIPGRSEWLRVLKEILDAYRALGVAIVAAIAVDVTEVTPRLASVRVLWELRCEDLSAIYDFTGVYTLARARGGWRVAAIAHDEVPKLRRALT